MLHAIHMYSARIYTLSVISVPRVDKTFFFNVEWLKQTNLQL